MPQLSVIIPVYNEAKTIAGILEKVNALGVNKEIIVVDDGSTDGTDKILRGLRYDNLKIIHHTTNRGKGRAFLTGLSQAEGEFVIIQDADLEYEPRDCLRLLDAVIQNKAGLALGARFTKGYHGLFFHKIGNRLLTGLINVLFNARINDACTCYKLMRKDTADTLSLKEESFVIDMEIVTKALRKKLKIIEVPVSYHPRGYSEGKKIRWKDAIFFTLVILKYRFS